MSDRSRNELGRFEQKVDIDEILDFFDKCEPATVSDIAHEFGLSNRAALNKLDELHDQGKINRKEVGSRAVVWWKPK